MWTHPILFILNPLTYPELSPAFGRLVLIDAKKAIGGMFKTSAGADDGVMGMGANVETVPHPQRAFFLLEHVATI